MVGVRLVHSSSQIPGYLHIHIFVEPCSTSHEITDTLAGMTDGAQYSQTLHERSVLTANMCLEAQQRTTRPLVFNSPPPWTFSALKGPTKRQSR